MNLFDIYKQLILDHNKSPRNFFVPSSYTHFSQGLNPLCGDEVCVYLNLSNKKLIEGLNFYGKGCAISISSASLMTEKLKGLNDQDAKDFSRNFLSYVKEPEAYLKDKNIFGKLQAYDKIWMYPSRIKCVSLPWFAFIAALNKEKITTTE
tara:strand:- start:589 stop:1038 length:450 start_codon:yes stop_codon:yes gene_type:complete